MPTNTTAATSTTSTTATASKRRRFARFAIAAAATGIAVGAATPAHAVVLDTDRPRFSYSELDFGTNWTLGAPLNGGWLKWDVTNGVVKPMLTGTLYINNASGTCARMAMDYYNSSGTKLASKSGSSHCATNGSLFKYSIDMKPYSNAAITKTVVKLQVQTGSSWSNVGTQTWLLG